MFCPECESKRELASMEMTPEILEEMAASEVCADYVGDEIYAQRLTICKKCNHLMNEMTCMNCGCFIQFRARHSQAACVEGKW